MVRELLYWVVLLFLMAGVACSEGTKGDGEPDVGVGDGDGGAPDEGDDGDDAGDDATDIDSGDGDPGDAGAEDGGEEPDAGDGDIQGDGDLAGDRGEPVAFSVLTINLKHPVLEGIDGALQRLQMVADAVNDRQPDVVALQEVIKDGSNPSFAEQLGGLTGYEWVWEFSYNVGLFDEGLGIISRWPIVWSDSVELPHVDWILFHRRVLGGRVDSPYGEIQLFCTHMTTESDETIEANQALAVFEFIQANPSPLPGFLAGDMNSDPHKLAMRFLRGEAEHEEVTGNLIDSWMTVNPNDDGFTLHSNDPTRRIDYIYLVPGSEKSADVDSCELMFTEAVGGVYASDHLGVLCRFSLRP